MIRDVLVCVNDSPGRDNTIRAAAQFAKDNDARLTGLHIMFDELSAFPAFGPYPLEMIDRVQTYQQESALKAENSFNNITSMVQCATCWHTVNSTEKPLKRMLYSDIVFTNQPSKDTFNEYKFVNSLILESGKPVMIIPHNWKGLKFGNKALLAWIETREAIQAVHAALPLMQAADHVDVVSVQQGRSTDQELADGVEISNYLSHRGVNCQFHCEHTDKEHNYEEDVLMACVTDYKSDLVIMGGYGHSRLREVILGGVTRHMISQSVIPVLLAH